MGLGLGCCRWTSLVIGYRIALLLARCSKRIGTSSVPFSDSRFGACPAVAVPEMSVKPGCARVKVFGAVKPVTN